MDELSLALAASGSETGAESDYFVIDNDLRTITIPANKKVAGVEHDDDVNNVLFSMPRYINDTDLSNFQIRINYTNALGEGDVYNVTNKVITEDTITFSWCIDRFAFVKKGDISFVVCARLLDNDLVDKEYNTTVHKLTVLEGLETDKAASITIRDSTFPNSIAIGDNVVAEKDHQVLIGDSNIIETKVYGDLIVVGTDNIVRKIVFNFDGSCSWETVS